MVTGRAPPTTASDVASFRDAPNPQQVRHFLRLRLNPRRRLYFRLIVSQTSCSCEGLEMRFRLCGWRKIKREARVMKHSCSLPRSTRNKEPSCSATQRSALPPCSEECLGTDCIGPQRSDQGIPQERKASKVLKRRLSSVGCPSLPHPLELALLRSQPPLPCRAERSQYASSLRITFGYGPSPMS